MTSLQAYRDAREALLAEPVSLADMATALDVTAHMEASSQRATHAAFGYFSASALRRIVALERALEVLLVLKENKGLAVEISGLVRLRRVKGGTLVAE